MVKHVIAQSIGSYGIVDIVVLIGVPVVGQLFGAKNKNIFVAIFIVFNNGKCGKSFTKSYAVCKNAAIIFLQFVDDGKGCILLKVIQHTPNFAFFESGCFVRKYII